MPTSIDVTSVRVAPVAAGIVVSVPPYPTFLLRWDLPSTDGAERIERDDWTDILLGKVGPDELWKTGEMGGEGVPLAMSRGDQPREIRTDRTGHDA